MTNVGGITERPPSLQDHPSDALLAEVRERYPTDQPSQDALDQKYARRRGPGWSPTPLETIADSVRKWMRHEVGPDVEVTDVRWLTGGASKIQAAFTLRPGDGTEQRLLVRMDPPETINCTNKRTEFAVMRAVRDHLPVPDACWIDAEAEYLPEPALICGFAEGVTKPRAATTGQVSGLGTNFGPALRPSLAADFVAHLGTLHTMPIDALRPPDAVAPRVGSTENALWRLNFERQLWELDRAEDVPVMEVAGAWLERNAPALDRASVVHGDYRSGNFLFDESTGRISAVLDWESAHLGDRHADLAYCTQRLYGHYAEDGRTFLASGLLPAEDLYEAYRRTSGLEIDHDRIRWYRMLATYAAIVKTLATSVRVARLGRSHQDVLLTRLEGVVPVLLGQLAVMLEEVL
ncbi:phosphotransferase family protein [Pseudonocardia kujensis]|uniref:phosphotransferase family protein n=1 Tax=Pseudonocardia kujensis TaxID=1128675 RepID=UPI001E2DD297|nr:phosphotransferase family protein [Pseudonocardia kujensis]MCE0761932.1 phosphotransferase family protein [Pseudonocardia kujensis]